MGRRWVYCARLAGLASILAFGASGAESGKTPPAPPTALPDPPLPVAQADAVGLKSCETVLNAMSHQVLTTRYDVQSGWAQSDPAHHVFQSVAALQNPASTPPDGLAALIAAPLSDDRCDGVALQIFPLAGDCQSAQRVMLRGGRLLAPMLNTRIMLDAHNNRVILLPGFNHTCVAVALDTHFDLGH